MEQFSKSYYNHSFESHLLPQVQDNSSLITGDIIRQIGNIFDRMATQVGHNVVAILRTLKPKLDS